MPGSTTPTIRRLRPADTPVVLAAPELFPSTPREEWVADLLAEPSAMLWWATNDHGVALGYLLATELSLPDQTEVFVYDMGLSDAVASEVAARVAAALVDRAATHAEDCGCVRLWGVPRPGASLYDDTGAPVSRLYLDLLD